MKLIMLITFEAKLALTGVTIVSIHTGATILARTWLALILFVLTVLSHPAGITVTHVPLHRESSFKP